MRRHQYCRQYLIHDVAIVQQVRGVIFIQEEGVKHFLLVLAKQEELFISQLALKELKQSHRPEQGMQ